MVLRWSGLWGFDERGFLAVTIVHYDKPLGWAVYIVHERLDGGPWPTEAEAMAVAEAAVAELPAGPRVRD
jgi:hypothetical protein